MKKLLALVFACIAAMSLFTLSSCKGVKKFFDSAVDEINSAIENEKANEIVGEYVLHEQIFTPMDENLPVVRYHVGDRGVDITEDSRTVEFKSDKTFKLTSNEAGEESAAEGTWQYANGDYPDYTVSVNKETANIVYDVTMEDKNTIVLTGDGMGLRFTRKGVTLTIGNVVGIYKLDEVIDTSGDVYTRIHDVDRGSNFTANDMVITLKNDGTFAATVFGESSTGTWVKNDPYIVTTANGNTRTLTIVEDSLHIEISAGKTYVLKKV